MTDSKTSLTHDDRPGSTQKQPRWGFVIVGIVVLAIILWLIFGNKGQEELIEDKMQRPSGTGMLMDMTGNTNANTIWIS